MKKINTTILSILMFACAVHASPPNIPAKYGVNGGLVVHLGCDKTEITVLRASERYVLHALDTDQAKVAKLRELLVEKGLNGPISVDTFDGKNLPLADNVVNLFWAGDPGQVPAEEVMRVLAPGGTALVNGKQVVKPVPEEIDEWTHYLHSADNNAVAKDAVVGPPHRTQWVGGPAFARSHEINSSMAAMVSAGGRLFYNWDENPTGMTDKRFPANWKLIARDAFNGIVLWKRPVPQWGWRVWHAESRWDDPRERAKMLRHLPSTTPRRLVAAGDRIYVTLGYNAPVSVLSATNGDVVKKLEGTALTDEILLSDGLLVLRVRTSDSPPDRDVWSSVKGRAVARVMVLDAKTGEKKWESKPGPSAPLIMAAGSGRVFYCDYERIVCLDLKNGKQVWASGPVVGGIGHRGTVGTLVAHEKAILFKSYGGKGKKDANRLVALSPGTGKKLWQGPRYSGPGITNPHDLFVAQGLVWIGEAKLPVTHEQIELRRRGFDPATGKVKREVIVPKLISWGHHYRCYRSRATERFLMLPKRGIEFVDLVGKDHMRHDWVRPPCIFGVMPANGLLYVAPHQCVCYQGVLISNFNALAPRGGKNIDPAGDRLEKGPAWGRAGAGAKASKGDWPTYRRDSLRSGVAAAAVPEKVGQKWIAKLRAPLTSPVVAAGRLLVAEKDAHVVRALDAATGKELWHFAAGARVDSPPTVHRGLVLFGSADGRVYCLRLSDGKEVWRFLAAPGQRRITAFGQVESAWPVHGSVLVQKGMAYCTAGRSTFLDGGIRVYALEPGTGKVLHEARLDGPRPDPFREKGGAGYMDGAKSDILTGDGADLYLFQERFGPDLARHPSPMQRPGKEGGGFRVYPASEKRGSSGRRIMTTHGFLSDVDNEGKYWTYGNRWPGWSRHMGGIVYGQLLVFDEKMLWGVQVFVDRIRVRRGRTLGTKGQRLFARPHGSKKDRWSKFYPLRVRALVKAGGRLFLAGPPDIVPEDDPLAAIQGRRGAKLVAVSAPDGGKVSEKKLDVPPVFDGMIAANGRLYISLLDGRVLCLGGE